MAQPVAEHPILITARLRLRPFRAEDTEAMHACFADADAMRYWDSPVFTKRAQTERAITHFIKSTPASYRFWAVADAASDSCLGMVNYHDGHMRGQRVTIGYIIAPSLQRRGLATEAVSVLLDHCFGALHLHRVQAFIHPNNIGSCRLVEKLGFHYEGLLRDNLRVGNSWRDDRLYALLKTDRRA